MEEQLPKIIEYAELLLEEGKKKEARLLVTAFLKRNPDSARGWWVLSQAVEDDRQEMDCLERSLRFDSANEQARMRLEQLKSLARAEQPPASAPAPVPAAQQSSAPTVAPFTFAEEDFKADVEGFDLFTPGTFQQGAATPAPAAPPPAAAPTPGPAKPAVVPSAGKGSEAAKPEEGGVPAWAVPPTPPAKGKAGKEKPPRKNRMSVAEIVLLAILLCVILAVLAFFGITELGDYLVKDLQATQQVAQFLASSPPQTLEPTWTASVTNTKTPTDTLTPSITPSTPTAGDPLLSTQENTPIPSAAIGLTVGLYPPDFTLLEVASGEQVNLSDYVGQPILIFFWATWCQFCNSELPSLQEVYEKYQEDGFVVLAVEAGEPLVEVDASRLSLDLTFPVLLDADKAVLTRYEVDSIPHHVFISHSGKIKYVSTGELSYTDLENKVKSIIKVFPTSTP